ncbi:hydantoinase B/oxoprolinase family protein [Halomontanus rarus]|uniref:hydantoinase B/oxoprolinase family protein n=1 Tax=Halomontanus rarus TaxID=3034020 RepID=UPI0023E80C2C|nr:hydantoinase B/oxoprolinase family protein [Halovivax sp. TS33]
MTDADTDSDTDPALDPISLEIVRNQLESIAEEMGQVLIRSAHSPNIKERRDCSTALFDAGGRLVAQAEHIPVHLGAMPRAVEAILERDRDPEPGDVFVLNDPFAGGTHLPDVTLVSPVAPRGEIVGYAVSRAHHADVGGATPGSMPAGATEIYAEGLRIPAIRLVREGELDADVLELLLANVRNSEERRADLRAQLAATERAEERVDELLDDLEPETDLETAVDAVVDYSRDRTRAELEAFPDGTYEAADVLEGDGITDGDVPIEAAVTVDGARVTIDFAGTAPQVAGNVNAPLSVATSAVYFVIRAVTDPEIPPNHGCYEPIEVRAPEGSLLNPTPPAAVVGGNVETSQRVADVVFAALAECVPDRVPAQGQGTMNNLIIGGRGRGGRADETIGADGEPTAESNAGFTYYETIGGGFGGRPAADGIDGVQVGMTNTLNTPVEALETEYPLRVERYALRPNTGGDGEYRGGLGLERSVTVETDAVVSLLTDRRRTRPAGANGGEPGAVGRNLVGGREVGSKTTEPVPAGTTITVSTPGGGGYGDPTARDPTARERDLADGKVSEGDTTDGDEQSQ